MISTGQAIPQAIHAAVPEHGEYLRPDYAILDPEGRPRLLVQVWPRGQSLEKSVAEHHWKASPDTRMMMLLREAGCKLGLLTNGEHWMLVYAPPRETTGYASWYSSLWLDEHATLRAFRTLLSARRFFSVAASHTLEGMLAESATNQQEVTNQLGLQVREAVTVLIQALDRADQDNARGLLNHISETILYEAALTVMMRLVFLFSAEERGLLLLGDPAWDQNYAVSTLQAQLREAADQHGEELMERRYDAWSRLLATFRAVYGGIEHERLRLPAYGGHLFDPDRFPFLEGRAAHTSWRDNPANPLPVDNRTVLHLLEALQYLRVQSERRRLSFRALDIEQIGHVYEGLLDHTAKRASEAVLGLTAAKDKSALIPLSRLEECRTLGEKELIGYLCDETGRSEKAIVKALIPVDSLDTSRYQVACGHDESLWQRVRPFVGLIRNNTFEYPLVILPGSVYVTTGADRRTSGSHYTPRSLTEPVVQYTLEPLVYAGPTEGTPRDEWKLRTPRELLDLKICDMATGSGAFLVQACRYLSELLVEAWEKTESVLAGKPAITPYGEVSTGAPGEQLIPRDTTERLVYARRLIAERCLYGVDKNPLAVEMAKLSLWLVTLDKGRAFTFLDHAIKSGDSLLGLWSIEQIQRFHIKPEESDKQKNLWGNTPKLLLNEALMLRKELESFSVYSVEDSERKAQLLARSEAAMDRVRVAGDLLIGAAVATAGDKNFESERRRLWDLLTETWLEGIPPREAVRKMAPEAAKLLNAGNPEAAPRRPFHWPLEFPEVFSERRGFDAIIGNPPFMGGKKITGALGDDYRDFLVRYLASGTRGHADLCAYFFLRSLTLVRKGGGFGLVATNTIAQGDTREVGLDQLVRDGASIIRAVPSRRWPGDANLEVAHVWVRSERWSGPFVLDDKLVAGITPFLVLPGSEAGTPIGWPATPASHL